MITINKTADQLTTVEKLAIKKGFAKAVDPATDFRVGGTLSAEQYMDFVQRITDQSAFLSKITRIETARTTYDLNTLAIESRKTKRPTTAAAWHTGTDAQISNVGNKLTLLRNQLVYILGYDAIQDNADNPAFQNVINNLVAKQGANDLADLAINGTDDDYTASAFLELNKGFLTMFTADAAVHDVTYANYADMLALFEAMLAACPEKYRSRNDLQIFVSYADHDKYRNLLHAANASGSAYLNAGELRYNGVLVTPVDFMPAGKAFLTPAENLVWAMGKGDMMSLNVVDDPEGVCYRLILNYMADFGYFDGDMVVFAA